MRQWLRSRMVASLAALSACGFAATLVTVQPAQAGTPEPLPWITTSGNGPDRQLVVAGTGERFVPRGNNYVRLARTSTGGWYHSTFQPGRYDPLRADQALAHMRRGGYNLVRVFVDPGDHKDIAIGEPHGLGHGAGDHTTGDPAYYDNLADFVRRAAAHRIYVLPSLDLYPQNARYWGIRGHYDGPALNITGWNSWYLAPQQVRAKQAYLVDFVHETQRRLGSLTSTFLALQTDNEAYLRTDQRPFSHWAGTVTPVDGLTYDMTVPAQRQQAADASLVVYARRLAAAVREVEPRLMVTMGMFTPRAVGRAGADGFATYCSDDPSAPGGRPCQSGVDYRYPVRLSVLSRFAALPFLDLHVYAAPPRYTLDQALASVEWQLVQGPVVVGEFGAERRHFDDDVRQAAYALRDLQTQTCARGFDGWLAWSWDTDDGNATQQLFVNVVESQGAVNGQLAPVARPDPCRP